MTLLESIFNHLVLPQKLPGQQDINIEEIEINVLTRLIDACRALGEAAGPELVEAWSTLGRSLRVCLDLNLGHLDRPFYFVLGETNVSGPKNRGLARGWQGGRQGNSKLLIGQKTSAYHRLFGQRLTICKKNLRFLRSFYHFVYYPRDPCC